MGVIWEGYEGGEGKRKLYIFVFKRLKTILRLNAHDARFKFIPIK